MVGRVGFPAGNMSVSLSASLDSVRNNSFIVCYTSYQACIVFSWPAAVGNTS
jgi:hypothetical protein